MNLDLVLKLLLIAFSISYLGFFIFLVKKDGFFAALTLYTIPERALTFLMGGKFWSEIDQDTIYDKVETKIVGEPIAPHNNYPKEPTHTFWGVFNTPEGRRELNVALIRPLWVLIPFSLFSISLFSICAFGAFLFSVITGNGLWAN